MVIKRKGRMRRVRTHKKSIKFELAKDAKIDYKNLVLLQKFLTDRGKIVSRRISGITGMQQRKMATAIKKSRFLGLLPAGAAKRK